MYNQLIVNSDSIETRHIRQTADGRRQGLDMLQYNFNRINLKFQAERMEKKNPGERPAALLPSGMILA